MSRKHGILAAFVALSFTAPLMAQTGRQARIEEARGVLDDSTALRQLMSALDPQLGAPDSLWTVAGFDIAQILNRLGQTDVAATMLRAMARHGSQWPIDSRWYPPSLVTAYGEAVRQVGASPDEGSAETGWQWPAGFDPAARGTITGTAGAVGASIAITGNGSFQAGGSVTVAPGTYEIVASADGYEPVRLTREVLPGVTTTLTFAPAPLLPSAIEAEAAGRIVRISTTQAGQAVCRTGYFAGTDGLVLTTFASVRGAQTASVTAGGRSFDRVPVVATDASRDLAVLRLDTTAVAGLNPASGTATGQYAWSVAHAGCDDVASTRTRLQNWSATSPAGLATALSAEASGAPLIDRAGFLIGIVTGPSTVLPEPLTRDILERARRPVVAAQVGTGGGFPWKWVGLGAAAAGGIFALVSGGGGGGDPVNPPTTGGIIITLPN